MKKISKIKLNQFSKDELDRRKLNALKGGCPCNTRCGCSSSYDVVAFHTYFQVEGYAY